MKSPMWIPVRTGMTALLIDADNDETARGVHGLTEASVQSSSPRGLSAGSP
jgi:hypothetical protein